MAELGDEASTKPIYVIDTSALIDLWLTYPHRTFERLWERFAALAAAGRLIAPEEVRHEISRRDERLKAWATNANGLFRAPDAGFMVCLARVVPECPYLTPLGRRYAADPWVVALALQISRTFTSKEQGSDFVYAGQSVAKVASDLRRGVIAPSQLPVMYVVRDGQRIAINNRSPLALRRANMEPTVTINVTGIARYERRIDHRLSEMGGGPVRYDPSSGRASAGELSRLALTVKKAP